MCNTTITHNCIYHTSRLFIVVNFQPPSSEPISLLDCLNCFLLVTFLRFYTCDAFFMESFRENTFFLYFFCGSLNTSTTLMTPFCCSKGFLFSYYGSGTLGDSDFFCFSRRHRWLTIMVFFQPQVLQMDTLMKTLPNYHHIRRPNKKV